MSKSAEAIKSARKVRAERKIPLTNSVKISFILGSYIGDFTSKNDIYIQLTRLCHQPDDVIEAEFQRCDKKVAYLWMAVWGVQRKWTF